MTTKKEDVVDNMAVWDAVSKTDVDHTKHVDQRGGFTAIDAHSQIMVATQQFGPIGQGWGYENKYGEVHLESGKVLVWCDVTLWWNKEGPEWEGNRGRIVRNEYGPVRGGAMLVNDVKRKPDTDAYKKASTDGLTKLLSHLGFNADVFLGLFDDNKYVEGLKKEKDAEQDASQQLYAQERQGFIDKIQACKNSNGMDAVLADYKMWIDRLPAGTAVELRGWVTKQKTEIGKDGSK